MYDERSRNWTQISIVGDMPAWRHGHVMICYYDYIFVFGGRSADGSVYQDLWIFDIVKRDWHMVADGARVHELVHDGLTGSIPEGRAFAQGDVFAEFGVAIISGGILNDGTVACDLWQLDLDMVMNFIESPSKFEKENMWKKLEPGQ